MSRLFPSPALSIALFVIWILLRQSLSVATILLGLALALFWPMVTARFVTEPLRLRRPLTAMALLGRVILDMLRSNLEVARAILTRRSRSLRSAFVNVPLELQNPYGLAALAAIVTLTPGTAFAQLSADRRVLLLHVFSLEDETSMINLIKRRYETPLKEIFE